MLVLASASPRRQELIKLIDNDIIICPSDADESYSAETPAESVPEVLAVRKAAEVAKKYPNDIVIGSDTSVIIGNEIRVLILNVEHIVLGVVLAGLRAVVAEALDIIEAYHIAVLLFGVVGCKCGGVDFSSSAPDFGVEVVAVLIVDFEQPRHMVDTCNKVVSAFDLVIHTYVVENIP